MRRRDLLSYFFIPDPAFTELYCRNSCLLAPWEEWEKKYLKICCTEGTWIFRRKFSAASPLQETPFTVNVKIWITSSQIAQCLYGLSSNNKTGYLHNSLEKLASNLTTAAHILTDFIFLLHGTHNRHFFPKFALTSFPTLTFHSAGSHTDFFHEKRGPHVHQLSSAQDPPLYCYITHFATFPNQTMCKTWHNRWDKAFSIIQQFPRCCRIMYSLRWQQGQIFDTLMNIYNFLLLFNTYSLLDFSSPFFGRV